ncbi:MAG: addiction module protein [Verrucomicrobiota bacterium]
MILEKIPEISKLSPRDKYILANELWDEVEASQSSIPFDDAMVELLEKRYEEYLSDPTKVISWEDLKAKLGKS